MPDFPEITRREDLTRAIRSIVLHWAGFTVNDEADILRRLSAYHYSVTNEPEPRIFVTRNVNESGAHTRRFNSESVGICFIGQSAGERPGGDDSLSEKQVRRGLKLTADCMRRWRLHPLDTAVGSYDSSREDSENYSHRHPRLAGQPRMNSLSAGDHQRVREIGRITRRYPVVLHHAEVNHLAGVVQSRKVDINLLEFRPDLRDYNYHVNTPNNYQHVFSDNAVDLNATGWDRHHVSTGAGNGIYHHHYHADTRVPTWRDIFGLDECGHWLRFEVYWYYTRLLHGDFGEVLEDLQDNATDRIAEGLRAVGNAINSPSDWMNSTRVEQFRQEWMDSAENASQYFQPELTDNWSVLEVRLQDADGNPVEGAKVLFIYDEDEVYVAESEADGYARPGMIQHAPDTEVFIVVPEYLEDPNDPDLGAARRWDAQHFHWGPWPAPLSNERVDAVRDLSKSDILDWDSVDGVEVAGEGLAADTVKHYMPTHGLLHVPIQAEVPVIQLGAPHEDE